MNFPSAYIGVRYECKIFFGDKAHIGLDDCLMYAYEDKNELYMIEKLLLEYKVPFSIYNPFNAVTYSRIVRYNSYGSLKITDYNGRLLSPLFPNLSIFEQDRIDECKLYELI